MAYSSHWTNSTPATTLTVTVAPNANDVLVMWCVSDVSAARTITWPSGFTEVASITSTFDNTRLGVAIKNQATGSETSLSVSNDGPDNLIGGVASYSGRDNTTPQDVAAVTATSNTSVANISQSITPASAGCDIVAILDPDIAGGNPSITFSTTSGTTGSWTTRADQSDGGFFNVGQGDTTQTTAGAITVQGASSVSGGMCFVILALRAGNPVTPIPRGKRARRIRSVVPRPFDIAGWFPLSNIESWFWRGWAPATSSTPNGTAAVTLGNDTSTATGTTTVVGTSARTLAGDTSSASGTTTILGAASPTLGNDASSASGAVGSPVTGTVAATLANDTASATGTTTVVGTSARTLAGDASSATGTTTIVGTSARTLAGDASSATGTTTIVGTSARTLGADTSSATGTTTVVGSAAVTLGSDTSTASGSVGGAVSGSGSPTTGNDSSSASGTTTVVGSASITLGSDTSAASGATPGPQVDEFAGFWAAAPRIRKRLDEEADAAIEAAEIIQRVATKAKDRQRAEQLEAAILAANTRAQYEALEARVRWAKKRAQELRRKDDDDIAAVLLLIE